MILAGQLAKAADELAPPGRPLMVHASLRSFGAPIAGGADALLDTLLARDRTVMVPAFTEPQFGLVAPTTMRPARNGIDYTTFPAPPPGGNSAYSVGCGLINPGLGVLPAALIRRAGAKRGQHPLNSFAALGPLAGRLIATQSPADVYGPIRELTAHAGLILLIGVALNRMTALHLAEQQSGRRLFLRWAHNTDGVGDLLERRHLIKDALADFDDRRGERKVGADVVWRDLRAGERGVFRPVPRTPHAIEWPQDLAHGRVKLRQDSRVRRDMTTLARRTQALILQHCGKGHAGGIVDTLVRALWVTLAQQLCTPEILVRLREKLIRVFTARRDSLQLPARDHRVDLGTTLIPSHDDSSSLTSGRSRTCFMKESAGSGASQ